MLEINALLLSNWGRGRYRVVPEQWFRSAGIAVHAWPYVFVLELLCCCFPARRTVARFVAKAEETHRARKPLFSVFLRTSASQHLIKSRSIFRSWYITRIKFICQVLFDELSRATFSFATERAPVGRQAFLLPNSSAKVWLAFRKRSFASSVSQLKRLDSFLW